MDNNCYLKNKYDKEFNFFLLASVMSFRKQIDMKNSHVTKITGKNRNSEKAHGKQTFYMLFLFSLLLSHT